MNRWLGLFGLIVIVVLGLILRPWGNLAQTGAVGVAQSEALPQRGSPENERLRIEGLPERQQGDASTTFAASIHVHARPNASTSSPLPKTVLLEAKSGSVSVHLDSEGTWSGDLDSGQSYRVQALSGDSGCFDFEASNDLAAAEASCIVVVEPKSEWTIEVVDAETSQPIKGITLAVAGQQARSRIELDGMTHWSRIPESSRVLGSGLQSPVSLDTQLFDEIFFVNADGYEVVTFKRSPFQYQARLALRKVGGLTLEIDPIFRSLTTPTRISVLTSFGDEFYSGRVDAQNQIDFTGIPEGDYVVRCALVEEELLASSLLFEDFVHIQAGEIRTVNVKYLPEDADSGIDVTVILPGDAVMNSWWLELTQLSEAGGREVLAYAPANSGPVRSGSSMLTRNFSGLFPGKYVVRLLPCDSEREVLIKNQETQDVVFELSALAEVDIHAGLGLEGVSIWWGREGESVMSHRKAYGKAESGSIFCEPGMIRLLLRGGGVISDEVTVEAEAGRETHVEMEVRPVKRGKVTLGLWDGGGHAFALGPELWDDLRVIAVGGQGYWLSKRFEAPHVGSPIAGKAGVIDWSRATLVVEPEGLYRVSSESLGFEREVWISEDSQPLELSMPKQR